jgi:predicted nucleotide-binding protein (sugar kinase/HSP70/actin superfamily)
LTTGNDAQARTIYFPGISDHFKALAAAYRAHGRSAEALPLTSRESMELGMKVCRGRECLYFVITLGDLLLRAQKPGFDAGRATINVPDLTTKCVFTNFGARKQQILAENGLGAVTIMTPLPSNDFEGLGEKMGLIADLSWAGMVAVDLLIQLQQSIRPYELEPGASDAAYAQSLARVVAATESGAIDAIASALGWAAGAFGKIPQDRSHLRPRIALVGEYLLFNPYLNLDLVKQIEALGGEVEINRYYKLFYGLNLGAMERALAANDRTRYEAVKAEDDHKRALEHQLVGPVKHLFTERAPHAISAETLRAHVQPHYSPEISNGGLDWAEALDLVQHGASGVIQLVPFLCIGAIVSGAMGPRAREEVGGVPWVELVFDAQGTTNVRTRLEAFMHQAAQFRSTQEPRPPLAREGTQATQATPTGRGSKLPGSRSAARISST